jgi:hypothetical protein
VGQEVALSYRDDLGSAMARIADLEAQLSRAESGSSVDLQPLLRQIEGLEERLKATEAAAEQQLEQAKASLEGTVTQVEAGVRSKLKRARQSMTEQVSAVESLLGEGQPEAPTAHERNRTFAPIPGGDPTGVNCWRCRQAGHEVEMTSGPISMARGTDQGCKAKVQSVLCPWCLEVALLRRR